MEKLDPQRERIQADLRGLVAGEVRCDAVFLQLYASDGSVYEIRPLGVVRPRSTADVVSCVEYAREKQFPLHARGAGTGVAGQSLGAGLVLDFSKHLRRILHIGDDQARVQPGLVHERLNAYLRARGRMFSPDPFNSSVTTVGSMIAMNATGSRRMRHGSTRDHLRSLQVVLADGTVLEVGREPIVAGAVGEPGTPQDRKRELVARLAALLKENSGLIEKHQGQKDFPQSGYNLAGLLSDGHLDLAKLLAGSEGTLALVTEATLATQPLPQHRGVALLYFTSLEQAARTALELRSLQPAACDLLDRRHLSLVRESDSRFELLIPPEAEAALLVEYEGSNPLEVRQQLQQLVDDVRHQNRRAFGARQAFDPLETELFWQVANRFQAAFFRLKGADRPTPIVEDMAVPPEALPEFLFRLQNVLKRHEITASVFCHALYGQVHMRPLMRWAEASLVDKMRSLADDVYQEVFNSGGGVGGENGCGLSRTSFLPRQYGELYHVFRQLKAIFDPGNLLNPGKIVGDDPDLLVRSVRPLLVAPPQAEPPPAQESPKLRNLVELQLNWNPNQVTDVAIECNGCGDCRTQAAHHRMCPIFRYAPAEEASPRAKANLVLGVLSQRLDLSSLTSDEAKEIADLCVHCHMCRLECPAAVDIPRLMREAKAAYVATNGMSVADWAMTRLDLIGAVASRFHFPVNWALGNRRARWLLEKLLGIAQGRKLPRVASRSFLRRCHRRRIARPSRRSGRKVLYFVDAYANYFDPQLAEALVTVLEHSGIEVYVHPEQKQAGMAAIARGSLDYGRALAEHNIALCAEAVRQGYHVVASEPSATLCLTREYPQLVDDEDARLVAENSSDAGAYLWKLHTQGNLQLDFRPVNLAVAYHTPCHLKALGVGTPSKNLLGLIPGLQVIPVEEGCSGMAGTFGLLRANYRASLRAGRALITRLRDPAVQAGVTECCTCKMQMEQGTNKPTIHPVKLLALAYGLMPEVSALLASPGEPLRVS